MSKFIAVIILGSALILAITSFWQDSLIVDEIPHVGSGYSYIKKFDYRLNSEHPPLAKALAVFPLLFLNLNQTAFQTKFWLQDINGQWDFGRFLIFQSGNNADLITKIVKFPMLIFFILSAILIYHWAKNLYSSNVSSANYSKSDKRWMNFLLLNSAPLIALIIFSFSPNILAHSRFVTTDIPALFGVLFATYLFLNFLRSPKIKNLWLSGLSFGIAMLTKFSLILLVPYFLILALINGLISNNKKLKAVESKIKNTILIFLIGFGFIVFPIYYLFTFNYPPQRQAFDTEFILSSFGNRTLAKINIWIADKPFIRAFSQYLLGLFMVGQRAVGGNTTYFLGEVSAKGWRYYFPVVYALKEPLPLLILLIIALLYLAWQFKFSKTFISGFIKNNFQEFAMILWLIIYWAVSIKSNLNIGLRHLFPTYPFLIILLSGQIKRILLKLPKLFPILLLLLCWYVIENIKIWPNYLTYFNQIAGGASGGYRYVVDSNLDWGQDLKRLANWVEENGVEKIYLDYFGWSDPTYYLGSKFQYLWTGRFKNAKEFLDRTGGGYIAVSATFYMGSREKPEKSYAWLDNFKPVAIIGNSIWVWKIEE